VQVLLPGVVHHVEDDEALHGPHQGRGKLGLAGLVGLEGGLHEPLHRLLGLQGPKLRKGEVLKLGRGVQEGGLEALEVPVLGVDLGVQEVLRQRSHRLLHHADGGLLHLLVLAEENQAALGVDDLPLAA
jgi:hypothetical protein